MRRRRNDGTPHQLRVTITPGLEGGYAAYNIASLIWSPGGSVPTAKPYAAGATILPDGWAEEELIIALAYILCDIAGIRYTRV